MRQSPEDLVLNERGFLLSDVLHQLSRADFPAVYVSLRIYRYTLCCTGSFHFERIRNAVQDLAVFKTSDPDPSLPSRMWGHTVRFRVGHINHVITDVDAAWAAKLLPFSEVIPVLIKNLDAHVSSVGNKKPSL